MIRHLTTAHLRRLADLAVTGTVLVRDENLLESAAQRPRTLLFGVERHPTPLDKAAASFHSIARFHPLIDGNKRLAWTAAAVTCEINGLHVVATNDEAYDVTIAVASGELREVEEIVAALTPLVRKA